MSAYSIGTTTRVADMPSQQPSNCHQIDERLLCWNNDESSGHANSSTINRSMSANSVGTTTRVADMPSQQPSISH
ncbi:hypothetical protein HNY73_004681 [Argiope bruennichi]|uniref:Uncharacterized protein n=1 Tax=Argiope bruennichi TaxID=94029 RepID=A0A8T0FPY7_ARGBR|nr:hypothetical protein HNY73_004681 [Argiope bruennichi]